VVDLSGNHPSVLGGYISDADLARQLRRSVRPLQRLAARRLGPPRTKIRRLIFYPEFLGWFLLALANLRLVDHDLVAVLNAIDLNFPE